MAICHERIGERDTAIEILYGIMDNIENKVVAHKEISGLYTQVAYLLSKWVGSNGRIEDAILLCDVGIKRCIEFGNDYSFPGLLYNKGYALEKLGRNDEASKYIQEAYYIYRSRGMHVNCKHTLDYANKKGIAL